MSLDKNLESEVERINLLHHQRVIHKPVHQYIFWTIKQDPGM